MAVQRAEDRTAELQARAGAVDELLASGALEDVTGTGKDDITAELERMASTSDVELELQRMKTELTAGPSASTAAIEGGDGSAEPAASDTEEPTP